MTLDKYVEIRIRAIFTDLAKDVSSGTVQVDDIDIVAGIPMALFQAENAMVRAWQAYLDEMPGQEIEP